MCVPPKFVMKAMTREEMKTTMEMISVLARERLAGTGGATQTVCIENPEKLMAKCKSAMPWKKTGESFLTVEVDRSEVTVCRKETPCAFCGESLVMGEDVVKRTCENATHGAAHVECWALMKHHAPEAHCCGYLRSRCEEVVVTMCSDKVHGIRDLAGPIVEKRLEAARRYAEVEDGDKRTRARHVMRASVFAKVLSALNEPDGWPEHDEFQCVLRGREVIPGPEMGGSCVVCGTKVLNAEDAAMTCKKHKAHYDCYAFSCMIAQKTKITVPNECPSYLFGNLECACAMPVMTLAEVLGNDKD